MTTRGSKRSLRRRSLRCSWLAAQYTVVGNTAANEPDQAAQTMHASAAHLTKAPSWGHVDLGPDVELIRPKETC